ncbi:MAG: signal recognition particle-docking protein FtsY [Raineya sp.]|nr:signal recognition particle-docking protein FtsY [Raineya sp.]MDW8295887.1 signal recognition particle-docking protein FtsY [Raineya sp.]
MGIFSWFSKEKKEALDKGLEKTKTNFFTKLGKAIAGKSKVDEEVLDELENILIAADVGVQTTIKIIQRIEERVKRDKYLNTEELDRILREEIIALLQENKSEDLADFEIPALNHPYVIMVVGVNGVGKTTTIGKLAAQYHQRGKKVVLAAADTFRAAAVEQLKIWGQRVGVPVIELGMGKEPASVVFEASRKATEMQADVLIIDTAGRLHNKTHLMEELAKMKRTAQKFIPNAPHEVLLVLDGSTGQNAVAQAREFLKTTDVTAIAITKLDGTAKGGVVIGISDEFKIPVKYIGVGEKIEDLQIFNRAEFVDSLFKKN